MKSTWRYPPVVMVTQLGGEKLQLAGWICFVCAWYGNLPCNWSLIVLMVLAGSKMNTSK